MKKIIILLSLLLMITGCSSKKDDAQVQKDFDAFIDSIFVEEMENDYISMHQYLEHPENYGVDSSKVERVLGERLTEENFKKDTEKVNEHYDTFQSFDREKLTSIQQDTYDIYNYNISIDKELSSSDYYYYDQVFSTMTGIHNQLPIAFADFVIRNEQDIKDLILLMKDVQPYIDSCIDYAKKQQEKELLMIDIDEVQKYCQEFIDNNVGEAVLSQVNQHIDELGLKDSSTYKKQLKDAYKDSFLPAYKDMISAMKELKKGYNNTSGLSKFPKGKEYYSLTMKKNVGGNDSVSDIKTLINNAFDDHMTAVQMAYLENMSLDYEFNTSFSSYKQILSTINKKYKNDFPKVKDIKYEIIDLHKKIANDGISAYFCIPSIDGKERKQIRVNPNGNDVKTYDTYQTVAHEGLPGHMYQYAYLYENMPNNYRKVCADSLAYTEGYAKYVERYASKYLDSKYQKNAEFANEYMAFNYALIVLMDIGIHDEGLDLQGITDLMNDKGLALTEESLKAQYNQLVYNPCVFEPYTVGFEKISAFKKDCQNTLGNKFKDKDFHEALLKGGTSSFDVTQKYINEYKESK